MQIRNIKKIYLNSFRRQKKFCAEVYYSQKAEKSLKFPLCITNLERLIQSTQVSVQPADSTPARFSKSFTWRPDKKLELEIW